MGTPPAADDPTVDLLQPELAPELDRLARLMADDDLGVRLEQADDLLACGHRLALEHAPHGLRDRLLDPRQEGVELPRQALGRRFGSLAQDRADPDRLSVRRLGNRDQLGIGLPHGLGHRLALATAEARQALHQAPRAAGARAEHHPTQVHSLAEHVFGPTQQPAQHPHAIGEQAAVAGMMDGGSHHRAVEAQRARASP